MATKIGKSRFWTCLCAALGGAWACSSEPPVSSGAGSDASIGVGGSGGSAGSNGASGSSGNGAAGSSTAGTGGTTSAGGTGGGGAPSDGAGGKSAPGVGCKGAALCWSFEEGRLPTGVVASRNEFAGELLVDSTRPHLGSYSLHAKDLRGGTPGTAGGPKKSVKFTLPSGFGPLLWGRMFVFSTPGRPMSHAGLFNARYPRPGSGGTQMSELDWYELATYQQKYMAVWHPPEPPGFPEWVLVSGTPSVLDTWACLEWEFDGQNGSAAEAAEPRVWLDGVELSWPEKFVFSDPAGAPKPVLEKATNFTLIETGIVMYQGLTEATSWWIDDLAIGSERIGCN